MTATDLDTLLEMGFDRERATLAVSRTGNLQSAIDWLDANQDKSLDEINASASTSTAQASGNDDLEEGAPALKAGEEAKSLVCNDCGKRFRSTAQAEFHATKTEHTDFSESTEEIAPLTEEQKAAKLQELRENLAAKRALQAKEDQAANKRNEQIRLKNTKEASDAKEALRMKEQVKAAEATRREKQAEVEAKKRIKAKIEADKEERRLKAEKEKSKRMGQTFPTVPLEEAMPAGAPIPTPAAAAPKSAASTARLRLTHAAGTAQLTLPAETTLFELAHQLNSETAGAVTVNTFTATFGARKVWTQTDFGMTLKEVGWVPSAAVVVG